MLKSLKQKSQFKKLSGVPTEELIREIARRKKTKVLRCGLYQKYSLMPKYDAPEKELPPYYYSIIVPAKDKFI